MFHQVIRAGWAHWLQIAFFSIVETLGAKSVTSLSRTMLWLKNVSDRRAFKLAKSVTLLLRRPIFSLGCLHFKIAYFAQECEVLLLQRSSLFPSCHQLGKQLGDLSLVLGTDLKSGQFLRELISVL